MIIRFLFLILLVNNIVAQENIYRKVDSLVKLMTVEEKISLLYATNNQGIERLGIKPFNWHNECLHGVVLTTYPATVFPQAIAMGATWNPLLINEVANAISDEARILYKKGYVGLNFWSPNLDLFRDPRWGRGQETYGEDPFLISKIANSYINGIQGDDDFYLKGITTIKHFVAHSGPEYERQYLNSEVTNRELWETFLPPFRSAIIDANANSIMSAYNAVNGIPCTANKYLLTDLAREKWGLKGNIFSDCWSVYFIQYDHHYVNSELQCVAAAINAGINIECGFMFQDYLKLAIENGLVKINDLDSSVSRILITQARLGIFEDFRTFKYNQIDDTLYLSQKHKTLAYSNALESYVLLKNENILPFPKNIKRLMLLGPNVTDKFTYRGSYTGFPDVEKDLYTELKKKFGDEVQIDVEPFMYLPGKVFEPFSYKFFFDQNGNSTLIGEYFDNINFEGYPIQRKDSVLDFHWYSSSPYTTIPKDSFAIRWTGKIKVDKSDDYLFRVYNDDMIKIYINDSLWVNDDMPGLNYSLCNPYFHKDSTYNIRIDFVELTGEARFNFSIANDQTGEEQYSKLLKQLETYDAIILSVGFSPMFENERYPRDVEGIFWGDRKELELPKAQERLIKEVSKIDIPTVLIIKAGTPIAIPFAKESMDAIIQLWYDGQEGGRATADILFGDAVPSGKLPITFYKSTTDLPEFTDYSMDNRTYRFFSGEVLYPFGYGLSYTTFDFSDISVNKKTFKHCIDDSIKVSFNIANQGNFNGKEVAQVYIKNLDSKFDYYSKQLKGFNKVEVNVGQKVNSEINVSLNEFYYYDETIEETRVFGGSYELQFGNSSEDIIWSDTILIEECNTNVIEQGDNQFNIYPNPSLNYIVLKNIENTLISKVIIRDILGNKVIEKQIDDYKADFIDIRTLNNGTYFVEIYSNNNITVRKFIKI